MRVRLTVMALAATVTSRPFRVGGSGKPVRIRRGPATVTGDAHRISATGPQRGPGRRERVEPGSQETFLRPSPFETLAERGWLMKKIVHRRARRRSLGDCVLAAPAHGRADRSTVRVEGDDADAACRARTSTTTTAPVGKAGEHHCAGTSALRRARRARRRATGRAPTSTAFRRSARRDDQGRDARLRERRLLGALGQRRATPSLGVCGQRLQEGDELAVRAASATPARRSPRRSLDAACPATVAPGAPVTVTVDALTTDATLGHDDHVAPAAGATVERRRRDRDDRRRRHGAADVRREPGRRTVQATQARHVRSAAARRA